ncbi:uncharacterized protein At4g19900-like isoform X2 [Mangifera indica]|uniref:uncharacterized protein At4g19900-like isoform X2 n=1 Tax=Mangifera indica TaxID=29780 RepID=UPI001CFACC9C|nr:uncharacterized protein At4g19900-like isoform X2 [Mangifera indica]
MLPAFRYRRPPRCSAYLCAIIIVLLLLLSVSFLHTRLSQPQHLLDRPKPLRNDEVASSDSPSSSTEDKIDELDNVDEGQENEVVDAEIQGQVHDQDQRKISSSGYYFDHVTGSIKRAFNKISINEWDFDHVSFNSFIDFSVESSLEDSFKVVFGSDDVPVNDEVRRKLIEVTGIEDALMLKVGRRVSPLREKWGEWFDMKIEFLRRDKMFKSHMEFLNAMNNPLLQDPDGVGGVSGLLRGDKVIMKAILYEFKRVPFMGKRLIGQGRKSEITRAKRRTLEDNASYQTQSRGVDGDGKENLSFIANVNLVNASNGNKVNESYEELKTESNKNDKIGSSSEGYKRKDEVSSHAYADGMRWGCYPGLHPKLSFSGFMDAFFRNGKCDMRVFMVWNSPPLMYGVRHQRGLESLLFHHRDACVVVFSETIELDFFKDSFVRDSYKVAVVMPNLDELLKDTPAHIFASVWFEWRKTKFYSTHYSELVRLAALYKYGGIYIDSDIIVLNKLSQLNNSVGLEDQLAQSPLNGAVMAFRKHRWNGADLLTRVARKFWGKDNISFKRLELKVQPSYIFFPVNSWNITRYFTTPATESERAEQDDLLKKILSESLTFHFWNSLTSAITPESESLVSRLIDNSRIHCSDAIAFLLDRLGLAALEVSVSSMET